MRRTSFLILLWAGGAWAEPPAQPASAPPSAAAADPMVAFEAGQWREAEAGFARQITQQPDAPTVRYHHAVAAALAGKIDVAEASAASVVRLDPGNEPAALLAAGARALRRRKVASAVDVAGVEQALRDGRLRTAARLAGRALAKTEDSPTRARLYLARGRALLALGRADEAAVALKAAAGIGAPSSALWVSVGRAFSGLGRAAAAVASLTVAAETTRSAAVADEARARAATLSRLQGR